MRNALNNEGQPILADPRSPNTARCPCCSGIVHKRKRRNGQQATYFYRHQRGAGDGCPLRYTPGER